MPYCGHCGVRTIGDNIVCEFCSGKRNTDLAADRTPKRESTRQPMASNGLIWRRFLAGVIDFAFATIVSVGVAFWLISLRKVIPFLVFRNVLGLGMPDYHLGGVYASKRCVWR
jgi:hypothetical protein